MTRDSTIRIALFNDTGKYPHVGCRAVSDAHDSLLGVLNISVIYRYYVGELLEMWDGNRSSSRRKIFNAHLIDELSSVDAVVVNGEGTIHHGAGLHLLAILGAAQELGKPTYLINAVFQDTPFFDDVLSRLRDLAVRDLYSYNYLRSKGIGCRLVADSIIGANFHGGIEPSFQGKIVVTDGVISRPDAKTQLMRVLEHYGVDAVYYPLEGENADQWKDALRKIRGASLVVTARHHGLYLALMSKVPFVVLPSNSWKVEGTLAALDCSDKFLCEPAGGDIITMCESVLRSASEYQSIYDHPFISNRLSTFDRLASDFSTSTREECSAYQSDAVQKVGSFYRSQWNEYWIHNDRMILSGIDFEQIARQIVERCGLNSVLDVGSGEGTLVAELLRRGVDAYGVDVSEVAVSRCNRRIPGRFFQAFSFALPFKDDAFHTVVSTECLEYLAPADVPKALQEIRRIAGRDVFLTIATAQDKDDSRRLTIEGRAWWEARCFEAGFRKHPAYYRVNFYEALNQDGRQIIIPLEKVPAKALANDPLVSSNEERDLHTDMLRYTGERSDGHVIRYQWACTYIKPGDRVLDAACGLGDGSYVMGYLTQAEKVVGFDGSRYAVDYATQSFTSEKGRVEYRQGLLPEALSSFEDGSFDVIVSFETLEHITDPPALIKEFYRLLSPGGRIIVSVPNDWSEETRGDPNPYHLHVYNWKRLQGELASYFVLEEAFAQTASRCKNSQNGKQWEPRPRSFRKVDISEQMPADCEWWLMVAMKSPLGTTQDYQERMFQNIAHTGHASIRYAESYQNPWLMHAMVNVGYRLKRVDALEKLASEVMSVSPKNSSDYAAALSVKAYRVLERCFAEALAVQEIIGCIDVVVADPPEGPMGLRWQVSLLFVKAKLLQRSGHLERAKATFVKCAGLDVRGFGIHLATKTTEAWFNAGKIAYSLSDKEEARSYWERGVDCGNILLSVSLDDILINRSFPNRFNHGDGVREYAVAWDNIARCANGLHLLRRGGELDPAALENCFQTEYSVVTQDLIECRRQLVERTRELVETREILLERTALLEQSSKGVSDLTRELVETRQTLVDRSKMFEEIRNSFRYRIKNKLKIFFNKL